MNLIELIKKRRSCRSFNDKEISDYIINDILTAGIEAPSSHNAQNYRFLVIKDKKEIEEYSKFKAPRRLNNSAKVWIVVFSDDTAYGGDMPTGEYKIWSKLWTQNCAAAIQNMLLAATYHKVGSCWISFIPEMDNTRLMSKKDARDLFNKYNIPKTYTVYGLVLLGYTNDVDQDGYPIGDRKHGNREVKRLPIEKYII